MRASVRNEWGLRGEMYPHKGYRPGKSPEQPWEASEAGCDELQCPPTGSAVWLFPVNGREERPGGREVRAPKTSETKKETQKIQQTQEATRIQSPLTKRFSEAMNHLALRKRGASGGPACKRDREPKDAAFVSLHPGLEERRDRCHPLSPTPGRVEEVGLPLSYL